MHAPRRVPGSRATDRTVRWWPLSLVAGWLVLLPLAIRTTYIDGNWWIAPPLASIFVVAGGILYCGWRKTL